MVHSIRISCDRFGRFMFFDILLMSQFWKHHGCLQLCFLFFHSLSLLIHRAMVNIVRDRIPSWISMLNWVMRFKFETLFFVSVGTKFFFNLGIVSLIFFIFIAAPFWTSELSIKLKHSIPWWKWWNILIIIQTRQELSCFLLIVFYFLILQWNMFSCSHWRWEYWIHVVFSFGLWKLCNRIRMVLACVNSFFFIIHVTVVCGVEHVVVLGVDGHNILLDNIVFNWFRCIKDAGLCTYNSVYANSYSSASWSEPWILTK